MTPPVAGTTGPDRPSQLQGPQPLHNEQVIEQCVEDTPSLWRWHCNAVVQPHYKLKHLYYLDQRLDAHLYALRTFSSAAWAACDRMYLLDNAAHVFTLTALALLCGDMERLRTVYAAGHSLPSAQRGITAAFGWISAEYLQGVVRQLLASSSTVARRIGIAACALHRAQPGAALDAALQSSDPTLQARALRAAGELGKLDLRPLCVRTVASDDAAVAFWAAWSSVMLGDGGTALETLRRFSLAAGLFQQRALQLTLQALPLEAAGVLLRELVNTGAAVRIVLKGSGIVGDVGYIPWLIEYMKRLETARVAGEAFSLITGADLAYLDLDCPAPEQFTAGPNDDPEDAGVAPDPDDNLPWPDPFKVQAWWNANLRHFQPGARYFMGEPLNRPNCLRVLQGGYQRQRIAASVYLSLLNPGTPLFEWRAPQWRQQHLLAQMK